MNIYTVTSLARPLDLNYKTNRAIAVVTVIVFAAGSIIGTGSGLVARAVWAVIAALTVFLSWALARELDPDYDLSAFVAVGFSLIGLIIYTLPSLLLLFWLLLVTRMVNRTTGLPAKFLDSLVILALAGWLTMTGNVVVGLMTTVAFVADSLLSQPRRDHVYFAGGSLVIVALSLYRDSIVFVDRLSLVLAVAVVLIGSLFLLLVVVRTVRAVGDYTAELLDPRRVQAAQMLALSTAFVLTVGSPGMLWPLWAAIIGILLFRVFTIAKKLPL